MPVQKTSRIGNGRRTRRNNSLPYYPGIAHLVQAAGRTAGSYVRDAALEYGNRQVRHWAQRGINYLATPSATSEAISYQNRIPSTPSFTETNYNQTTQMPYRTGGHGGVMGKRYRTGKAPKNPYSGFIQQVVEQSGTVADTECVYVGHATAPPDYMLFMACRACIRALFAKAGKNAYDEDQVIPFLGGIYFMIRVNPNEVSGPAGGIIPFGSGSTYDTILKIADRMRELIVSDKQTVGQIIYDSIELRPSGGLLDPTQQMSTYLDLSTSMLHLVCHSHLKVQNRTKHVADIADDAELVTTNDVVPLIGKLYTGGGTGFFLKRVREQATGAVVQSQLGLTAQRDNGIIAYAPGEIIGAGPQVEEQLQEPPSVQQLRNVKGYNGVKAEPGVIISHFLKFNKVTTMQYFLLMINKTIVDDHQTNWRMGSYGTFALEKYLGIKSVEGALQPKVVVGYEINNKFMSHLTWKKQTNVIAHFSKADPVNVGTV